VDGLRRGHGTLNFVDLFCILDLPGADECKDNARIDETAQSLDLQGRGYTKKLGQPGLLFASIRRKNEKRLFFGKPFFYQRLQGRKRREPFNSNTVRELVQRRW